MKNPKVKAWLSLIVSFALRRLASTHFVQKGRSKEAINSRTCETGVHHFTPARNPRKHCVSSRCTRSSAG